MSPLVLWLTTAVLGAALGLGTALLGLTIILAAVQTRADEDGVSFCLR